MNNCGKDQPFRRAKVHLEVPTEKQMTAPPKRSLALDNFRGLALWMMVSGNFLAGVSWVPAFLKHPSDVGLTLADIVAPLFIFAIGITYRTSYERRLQTGNAVETYLHFIKRYATLMLLGFVLSSGEIWVEVNQVGINWGVLQSISVAGLMTLTLIHQPTQFRLWAGIILLSTYQFLLDRFWLPQVLLSPHGGWQGSLGWAAMLILATVLSDIYHRQPLKKFIQADCLTLLLGVIIALQVPISKHRVSASYALICLGLSGLLLALFTYQERHWQQGLGFLNRWGKNPLLIFLLHNFLLAIFVLPPQPEWYRQANFICSTIQLLFFMAIIDWVTRVLARRELIISL